MEYSLKFKILVLQCIIQVKPVIPNQGIDGFLSAKGVMLLIPASQFQHPIAALLKGFDPV